MTNLIPTDITRSITVVLTEDLLDAIEFVRWCSPEPDLPSRSDTIRSLLMIGLSRILPDDLDPEISVPFLDLARGA